MDIRIDPEFKSLIPALKQDEYAILEASILADGCRDALVVWPEAEFSVDYSEEQDGSDVVVLRFEDAETDFTSEEEACRVWYPEGDHDSDPIYDEDWPCVLIDGHNRYAICQKHGIEFETVERQFESRDAALDWIDANQLGRRNLTPDQFTLLLGRRYNRAKKAQGGTGANQHMQKDQIEPSASTAEKLAKEHGVSPATVKRAGQYADAIKKVDGAIPGYSAATTAPRQAVVKAAALIEHSPARAEEILNGGKSFADVRREEHRADIVERLESIEAVEAKATEGVYDVIVIDPPWAMQKIERDVRPNQSEFDYPTMTESELETLEIPCADDCHVWVWTTHKFLPMALRLIESWGMKYVCTMVWHKPGGFQPMGLPQYNCEFSLYARKGTPEFIDTKAFPVCFQAPRGAHSEKPDEFYSVVRRVTAGRRLDMFSRRAIDGFVAWGEEVAQA